MTDELLDFSDLGGKRVALPPGYEFDFSDLGGQRVGRADTQEPSGGFFGRFGDLGSLSVQNHPEWLKGRPVATTSAPSASPHSTDVSTSANEQTTPLDFSDLGGQKVAEPAGHTLVTHTRPQHQAISKTVSGHSGSSSTYSPQPGQPANFAQISQGQADRPGFSQRYAEGMGIPVTQEEDDAMREDMKPKWYDLVAPGLGRGLKMAGQAAANYYQHAKTAADNQVQAVRDIAHGAPLVPTVKSAYVTGVEHGIKSLPGGEQLWNYGQDINEGNWRGAAGGATAGVLQLLLMDAMARGEPNARAGAAPNSGPQAGTPAPEVTGTPRSVAETSGQPSGNYERGGNALTSKPATSTVPGQKPPAVEAPKNTSANYRETFFKTHPELRGNVWVHHAIEQQVLKKFPGLFSEAEIHALENLRGIPNELNPELHLSNIRKEWNSFYRTNPNPTPEQFRQKAVEIDAKYGSQFKPSR